jgi:hypothetical protein
MGTNPNITLGGNQLHGVASGGGIGVGAGTNAPNNADVKSYVDAVAQGLKTKGVATAVVLANVASLTGLAAVGDGVTLGTDGMIALLTAQSTGFQNGAWVVHAGAWTRPANFAAGSSAAGAFWIVEQGTLYHDTGWVCSTDPPSDVVDTNSLALSMFFSATALSNADGTLVFTGTDVRRAAITGDVGIPAGSNVATIANAAVTATKLANTTVTAGAYGDASHVGAYVVDAQGRLTGASAPAIAIDTAAVTTGTFVAGRMPGFTGGDVTSSPGSLVLTIGTSTVTLAKMANLAAQRLLGNDTGTGAPVAISVGQGIAFTGSAALANTLITGLSSGQTITGGTAASDPLTIRATSHATPGTVTISGGVDGSGIALALNNGNSTGTGGAQIALGYNGSAQFRQSIRTRHNSGAAAGNGIDFFTWTPTDSSAIGSVRALSIEASGIGVPSLSAGGIVAAAASTGTLGIAANATALAAVSGANTGDQTITLTGDVTGSGTGSFAATLAASGVAAATYGDASHVAQIALDSKGRATLASNVLIQIDASAVATGSLANARLPVATTGAVLFGRAGGGYNSDSVIAVDSTNHRLGVGTASPSYTLEVLGMTRHSGATGINANPDAEAAFYLQTQITGDRDRMRFRFGGSGTALPTTATPVGYVKWSPGSTTIAAGATVAALHTHHFEQQTFSLGAGATIADTAPATVTIDGAPNFVGAGTPPANPRALRVKVGDIAIENGNLLVPNGHATIDGNIESVAGGFVVGSTIIEATSAIFAGGLAAAGITSTSDANILGDIILGGEIQFSIVDSPGSGATATLAQVGSPGPSATAQTGWLRCRVSGNTIRIPYWQA